MAMMQNKVDNKVMIIDLSAVAENAAAPFLSGKDRGEQARRLFELDKLDEFEAGVLVRIPDSIESISSSFSLGLFSESVEHLGSVDAIVRHFRFEGATNVIEKIITALINGQAGPARLA